MKKGLILFLLMFYAIGLFGYVVGGVHLLDNQDVTYPVWNEVEIDGETYLKKTKEIKNVGYDPTISYWVVITGLIIGMGITFVVSDYVEKTAI